MIDLKGKVALVTGSSRGIGRAIAIELARNGAFVYVNYRKREEEAQRTLKSILEVGGSGAIVRADVSVESDVDSMFEQIQRESGKLDILINNAGWGYAAPFRSVDVRLWDRTINVNLRSVFLVTRRALELMDENVYGRIVNISSIAGVMGFAFLTPYSAAKAGIIGFTKALAQELANTEITVNAIAAGIVKTDMGKSLFDVLNIGEGDFAEAFTLTGKVIEPEEIAKVVLFLVSDDARNITGQVITVDSGFSLSMIKLLFRD